MPLAPPLTVFNISPSCLLLKVIVRTVMMLVVLVKTQSELNGHDSTSFILLSLGSPQFSSIWIILSRTKPPQEPVSHLRRADLVAPLLLLLPRVPGNPQGGVLVTLLVDIILIDTITLFRDWWMRVQPATLVGESEVGQPGAPTQFGPSLLERSF